MRDKNILATYRDDNGNFTYAWLEDEELEEWIEESKVCNYTEIEVVRVQVLEEMFMKK